MPRASEEEEEEEERRRGERGGEEVGNGVVAIGRSKQGSENGLNRWQKEHLVPDNANKTNTIKQKKPGPSWEQQCR